MNKAAAAAAGVIARQGAGGVVVGLPRNMDGTEGARAAKAAGLRPGWPPPAACRWCCGTNAAPP